MKNLLYKEFKLAMHPMCYLFTFLFPLMILIPNNPSFTPTLYIVPLLSILFLGANKGRQSNDLFYTVLLPVRKKDVVKGRMASVFFMEFCTLITISILSPIKIIIDKNIASSGAPGATASKIPGFTIETLPTTFAFVLIGYALVNFFFFIMFYHKGRSVTAPTLCSTFGYIIYVGVFTAILPAVSKGFGSFYTGFGHLYIEFIYLIVSFIIFIVLSYVTYRIASKELERVDL